MIMKMVLVMVRMMLNLKSLTMKFIKLIRFSVLLSFVSLFSGSTIEPLYFVQITGKCVAEEDISDPYGHFALKGMLYVQGFYLKAVRSISSRVKKFLAIPTWIIMTPDEIYNTYVDFNDNLELDVNTFNTFISKTRC